MREDANRQRRGAHGSLGRLARGGAIRAGGTAAATRSGDLRVLRHALCHGCPVRDAGGNSRVFALMWGSRRHSHAALRPDDPNVAERRLHAGAPALGPKAPGSIRPALLRDRADREHHRRRRQSAPGTDRPRLPPTADRRLARPYDDTLSFDSCVPICWKMVLMAPLLVTS